MKPSPVGSRGAGYGLDAELARKQAEKYDHQGELMARNWIEKVTNEKMEGDFGPSLKNGQLLCKLMNTIKPGSIRKIETSNMPFKQMENISNFLKAARTVGIAEYELFETVDLYEEKDLGVVVRCLHSLSRTVQRNVPTFTGPYLDPTFNSGNNLSAPLAAVSIAASPPAPPPPPPKPRPTSPAPSSAAIAATLRPQPTTVSSNQHGLNSTSAAIYQPNSHANNTPAPSISKPAAAITSSAPSMPPPKPAKPTSTTTPVTTATSTTTTTSAYGSRGAGFGLDAELAKKQAAKYDPALEAQAREWIEAVTGETFGNESFASKLKNGELLCKLINCIQPNTIKKVNSSAMPFKQMENISSFLRSCRTLGVSEHDLFETVDLFEEKDLNVVVLCIFALGRTIQTTVPSFSGPTLGPRLATSNHREFTPEQLAKTRLETGMTKISAGSREHMARSEVSTSNSVTFGADTVGTGDSGSINVLNQGSVRTMDRTHISKSGSITFGHEMTK